MSRIDPDEVLGLVRDKKYFVLHAPRQTGKTSALLALAEVLNGRGYRCVYVTVETARTARDDVQRAMRTVLVRLASQARATLDDGFPDDIWPDVLARVGADEALGEALSRWAEASPLPLVLLIDEIDTLVGDLLLSVLQQLRAGYPGRPARFPHSVVLSGMRDLRDYRMGAAGSPFNIAAASLRLGDFSREQTLALLGQHTAETGQAFAPEALEAVWTQTRGQPWLVNALAYGACFENKTLREDRSRTVTADDVAAVRAGLPHQMAWYVGADGGLDVAGRIAAFQEFFREHSEYWVQRFERYHEAGPQLLLQAHLQRIVNGGGRIEREYALGRGRTDLLIVWPQGGRERRFVVECKVLRKELERTIADGVEQTRRYVDRCGAEAGHLGGTDLPPHPGGNWRAGHGLGDVAPPAAC